MKEKQLERVPYITPWCEARELTNEEFICTSVVHQASGSTEEDWNNEDIDGGEIEL